MTVTVAQHKCRPSPNPRHAGYCACGREMPVEHVRDPEDERKITEAAAKPWGVDTQALSAFADHRADKGPIRDLPTRDFILEVREELADARNYCCWQIQQLRHLNDGTADQAAAIQEATYMLGAIAAAYSALRPAA